jgi:hypothetical protein
MAVHKLENYLKTYRKRAGISQQEMDYLLVLTEERELLATSVSNERPALKPHSHAKQYFIRRYVSFSPASMRERSGAQF